MSIPLSAPRLSGGWLTAPSVRKIFTALRDNGSEARAVGGAVRDALVGRFAGDLDLATPTAAEDVMKIAGRVGLSAYPTGLSHGTVTIVSEGVPVQVTTLRRDVRTDGRHAVVAYTNSWVEDAARRDFTINALYCDEEGRIYDYHGGVHDLEHRHVRFIGDPQARIREDYLRILRLFRFSSTFADGALDPDGLAAARSESAGLAQLSAERVRDELLKLLVSPRAAAVVAAMHHENILQRLLGPTWPKRLARFIEIEFALGEPPDAMGRLLALAVNASHEVPLLAERLRLSNAQSAALGMAAAGAPLAPPEPLANAKAYIFHYGAEAYGRALKSAWANSDAHPADVAWRTRRLLSDRFRTAHLPVGGADVLALGVPAGPKVGTILDAFERWWFAQDHAPGRERSFEKLRELIAYA